MKFNVKVNIISILAFSSLLMITGCDSDSRKLTDHHGYEEQQKAVAPVKNEEQKANHSTKKKTNSEDLNQIIELAKQGKIKGSNFALNSNIKNIQNSWGKSDSINKAGSGYYAVYQQKGITIGYNMEGNVFDLRSYDESLKKLTLLDLENALGKSKDIRVIYNDKICVYKINDNIELKFIFPINKNYVDHISVYSEKYIDIKHTGQKKPQLYFLDIKGNSSNLSAKAWKNMLNWRKNAVIQAENNSKEDL